MFEGDVCVFYQTQNGGPSINSVKGKDFQAVQNNISISVLDAGSEILDILATPLQVHVKTGYLRRGVSCQEYTW